MLTGPSLCTFKLVYEDDLGSTIQSSGSFTEVFLLAQTLTRCQLIYHILHYLGHRETNR